MHMAFFKKVIDKNDEEDMIEFISSFFIYLNTINEFLLAFYQLDKLLESINDEIWMLPFDLLS